MTIPAAPYGGYSLANLSSELGLVQSARDKLNRNIVPTRSNLERKYKGIREQLPGQYARRGMVNSGIYNKSYARSFEEQERARQSVEQNFNDALEQLFLRQSAAESAYAESAGQQALENYLAKAALAAEIKDVL
jgi:hypothetical protein